MTKPRLMEMGLALVLGVCAPWVLGWLTSHTFRTQAIIVEPVIVLLRKRYAWNLDQIRPVSRILFAILSIPVDGLIGLALGLLVAQHWRACWFAFLGAFLITQCIGSIESPLGVEGFLATVLLPEFWLTLLATFVFTFIGYRVRKFYVSSSAQA
jgi:hypothetical protein